MSERDKQKLNYDILRKPRSRAIKQLNNLYVLANLTSKALSDLRKRVADHDEDEFEFDAPSADGETTVVVRDISQLSRIVNQARKRGIYEQSLVTAVASTEDYVQQTLKFVLRLHPGKLNLSVDGTPTKRSVPLDLVLRSTSLDQLLSSVIQKQLISTFYGSPERYFHYIEAVLSIEIDKKLQGKFQEIKATRDIIIHNSGYANEVYVEKAGRVARAQAGHLLQVDDKYFERSIQTMKELTQQIYSKTLNKHGDALTSSSEN
jgi:hypothetical protein